MQVNLRESGVASASHRLLRTLLPCAALTIGCGGKVQSDLAPSWSPFPPDASPGTSEAGGMDGADGSSPHAPDCCVDSPALRDGLVSQAVVLASGQASPSALAVDAGNLYWLNMGTDAPIGGVLKAIPHYVDGQVLKCATSGCVGNPTVLASGREDVESTSLVVDGVNVYWIDNTPGVDGSTSLLALLKCSVDGCHNSPMAIGAMEPASERALAVDGTDIYWTNHTANVRKCPLEGCDLGLTALWSAGNTPSSTGIAIDATDVYWATQGPANLMKCAKTGCNNVPTEIMSITGVMNPPDLAGIALDGDNVYAGDRTGKILRCAKTGCGDTPTVLADGLDWVIALATDGVNVYWTDAGGGGRGVVRRCAVGGCNNAPTIIASGLNNPVAIAVDDKNVYWAEQGSNAADGRIWMAPKLAGLGVMVSSFEPPGADV